MEHGFILLDRLFNRMLRHTYSAVYPCKTDNPGTWLVQGKNTRKLWQVDYILTRAWDPRVHEQHTSGDRAGGQCSVKQTIRSNKSIFRHIMTLDRLWPLAPVALLHFFHKFEFFSFVHFNESVIKHPDTCGYPFWLASRKSLATRCWNTRYSGLTPQAPSTKYFVSARLSTINRSQNLAIFHKYNTCPSQNYCLENA